MKIFTVIFSDGSSSNIKADDVEYHGGNLLYAIKVAGKVVGFIPKETLMMVVPEESFVDYRAGKK